MGEDLNTKRYSDPSRREPTDFARGQTFATPGDGYRRFMCSRAFPNARVVELPAGHAPQLETPAAFEGEVEGFLGSLPA